MEPLLAPSRLRCRGDYLAGIATIISTSEVFAILARIDYSLRYWSAKVAVPFGFTLVEDEFRHALRLTASSGRALEVNSRLPMNSVILAWWCGEDGDAVTFGSDACRPLKFGHGFSDAARMAGTCGFHGGSACAACGSGARIYSQAPGRMISGGHPRQGVQDCRDHPSSPGLVESQTVSVTRSSSSRRSTLAEA